MLLWQVKCPCSLQGYALSPASAGERPLQCAYVQVWTKADMLCFLTYTLNFLFVMGIMITDLLRNADRERQAAAFYRKARYFSWLCSLLVVPIMIHEWSSEIA